MIPRNRQFERTLSHRLKPYDASRQMSFGRRIEHNISQLAFISGRVFLFCLRSLVSLLALYIIGTNSADIASNPEAVIGMLSIWCIAHACFRADTIGSIEASDPKRKSLYSGILIYRILPVALERVFDYFRKDWTIASLWLVLECFSVYAAILAGRHASLGLWLAAIACACIQWGLSWAISLLLTRSRWKWQKLITLLICLGLVFCWVPDMSKELRATLGRVSYMCLPVGWGGALFLDGFVNGRAAAFLAAIPIVGLLATLRFSIPKVRDLYYRGAFDKSANVEIPGLFMSKDETMDVPVDATNPFAEALRPPNWNRSGWVGKLVASVLSQNEKRIAGYMRVPQTRLTLTFYLLIVAVVVNAIILLIALHGAVTGWASIERIGAGPLMMFFFSLLATKGMILFLTGSLMVFSAGSSFEKSFFPFRGSRLFPISFWAESRVFLKSMTVTGLLIMPLFLFCDQMPGMADFKLETRLLHWTTLKTLLIAWGCLTFAMTMPMRCYYRAWSRFFWREALEIVPVGGILFFLATSLFLETTLWLEAFLAAAFILGTLAWYFRSGARYMECSFTDAVRSMVNH